MNNLTVLFAFWMMFVTVCLCVLMTDLSNRHPNLLKNLSKKWRRCDSRSAPGLNGKRYRCELPPHEPEISHQRSLNHSTLRWDDPENDYRSMFEGGRLNP